MQCSLLKKFAAMHGQLIKISSQKQHNFKRLFSRLQNLPWYFICCFLMNTVVYSTLRAAKRHTKHLWLTSWGWYYAWLNCFILHNILTSSTHTANAILKCIHMTLYFSVTKQKVTYRMTVIKVLSSSPNCLCIPWKREVYGWHMGQRRIA